MIEGPDSKRRFPRLASRHAVLVKTLAGDAVESIAPTKSIALGGCSVITDRPLGVGERVELLISLGQQVLQVEGRVVYEAPAENGRTEVGVEFTKIPPDAAARIGELLNTADERAER